MYTLKIRYEDGTNDKVHFSEIVHFEIKQNTIVIKTELLEIEFEKHKELTKDLLNYFNPVNEN